MIFLLSPASLKKTAPAPPLMKWPARLSQQKRLIISEGHNPTPSATTRVKRDVETKFYKQARLESQ